MRTMELVPLLRFRIIQTHILALDFSASFTAEMLIFSVHSLQPYAANLGNFLKLFVKKTPRLWVWTQRRSHLCCERKLRRAESSGELGREAMHSHSLSILVLKSLVALESNWSQLIKIQWVMDFFFMEMRDSVKSSIGPALSCQGPGSF